MVGTPSGVSYAPFLYIRSTLREMRALGYVLVALPVLFTLFPGMAELPVAVRLLTAGAWIGGLFLLQRKKSQRDDQIAELVEQPLERQSLQRQVAGEMIIPAVLRYAGFPDVYEFRLYLFDEDAQKLVPSYEPGHEPSTGWQVGQGITGKAWETGEYEAASGERLSAPEYGLTPEQRTRYSHLRVVAAMPVRSARNEVLAVLTGSTSEDDDYLLSPEGREQHRVLADVVARVLIDVLQLTTD